MHKPQCTRERVDLVDVDAAGKIGDHEFITGETVIVSGDDIDCSAARNCLAERLKSALTVTQ